MAGRATGVVDGAVTFVLGPDAMAELKLARKDGGSLAVEVTAVDAAADEDEAADDDEVADEVALGTTLSAAARVSRAWNGVAREICIAVAQAFRSPLAVSRKR
jgi:hypothetical protein